MADIKISELTAVSSLNNGDLVEVSQVNALAPSGYTSLKASMADIGKKVNTDIDYTTDLADFTDKTTLGAIKETAKDKNVADEYDGTQTYNKGDVVIYKNTLYICTTNNTTGAWDATKWTATTVQSLIGSLSNLTTTDKSSIVGAVNEVNDKVDAIGTIIQGSSTGGSAVFTRTWSAKASITLTKGVWIINTRVLLQQDNNGYRALNIAASMGENTSQCTSPAVNGNLTALNMSVMQNVTSSSMTFYLNGVHNSTQNSELSMITWYLNAVRIA